MTTEKQNALDETFMARAFELAKKGYGNVSPNPYVGAVIVKDGRVIGEGYHEAIGKSHAEINAIESATESLEGSTIYITLEPCCHVGKTGACTEAILNAGITRVVTAMEDPNVLVKGNGHQLLRDHGLDVTTDIAIDEAKWVNRFFSHNQQSKQPYITLKAAMSLDGKIATQTNDSQWITGPTSRKHAHFLRGLHDAIIIGKGTLLSDDPTLNVRYDYQVDEQPVRILLLRSFDGIDPDYVLFNTEIAPTWIIYPDRIAIPQDLEFSLLRQEVEFHPIPNIKPHAVVKYLYEQEIYSLLIEGGASIYNAFLNEALVDEYALFYGPKLIGNGKAFELWKDSDVTDLDEAQQVEIISTRKMGESIFVQAIKKRNL